MTGDQLKALRISRGLTREQFAAEFNTSASTLNKWERNINPVPDWVEEKALRNVPLTLPLEALARLLDYSRNHDMPFERVLALAIQQYLAAQGTPSYSETSRPASVVQASILTDGPEKYRTAKTVQEKNVS